MKKNLDALYLALAMESQGEAFYRLSAARVTSKAAKEMFLGLADWEVEHQQYIKAQIESLISTKAWPVSSDLPSEASTLGPSVFRARSVDYPTEPSLPVEAKTTELTALRMALFIEEDLHKFYVQAAKDTDDPDGKAVFVNLAAWEVDHRDMLDSRYQLLKEEFFATLGVSPGY